MTQPLNAFVPEQHESADYAYDAWRRARSRPSFRAARRLQVTASILIGFTSAIMAVGVGGGMTFVVLGLSGAGYVDGTSVKHVEIMGGLISVVGTAFAAGWMMLLAFWAQAFARTVTREVDERY